MTEGLRLMFAGGGTGGHLFPAIAIADRMKELLAGKMQLDILFVGTRKGIEYRLKDQLGYPLHLINIRGISRSLSLKNLIVPVLMVSALMRSSAIISKFSPHIVIGTGGYVSWPVVKAAIWKKLPVVLQEQNSYPGVVTRTAAGKVRRVYLGFAGARNYLNELADTVVTGNPVRLSVTSGIRHDALERFGLDADKQTVLVLGGSQGARSINSAILNGLDSFNQSSDIQLLWQTGKRDYKEVVASAGERAEKHTLFPYENNMAAVYAAADIAIARAGALTLAELQACRIPSILIPYPHAAGNHQQKNGQEFAAAGFAELMDEQALKTGGVLSLAKELLHSGKAELMRAAMAASSAGKPRAVDNICSDMLGLLGLQQLAESASEC